MLYDCISSFVDTSPMWACDWLSVSRVDHIHVLCIVFCLSGVTAANEPSNDDAKRVDRSGGGRAPAGIERSRSRTSCHRLVR